MIGLICDIYSEIMIYRYLCFFFTVVVFVKKKYLCFFLLLCGFCKKKSYLYFFLLLYGD